MYVVCLDLEGVLIPEIWINVALKTGIEELKLTTRDISDYDVLMKKRIEIMDEHKLKLKDIQDVIATMDPMEGAFDFLDKLRSENQVVILSDTFRQFAKPMMKKLAWPTLFCNDLIVNNNDQIVDYRLRQKDGKKFAVQGFHSMGLKVVAAGDSYNDLSMIREANGGVLFCPPEQIVKDNPDLPVALNYADFYDYISEIIGTAKVKA